MSTTLSTLIGQPLAFGALIFVSLFFAGEFTCLAFTRSSVIRSRSSSVLDGHTGPSEGNQSDGKNQHARRQNARHAQGGLTEIGIPLGSAEWLALRLVASLALGIAGLVMGSPVWAALLAAVPIVASTLWLDARKKKVGADFEDQVLRFEMQLAENSRAGLSLEKSLRSCLEHAEFPLREHIDRLITAITYSNMTISEAFRDFAHRSSSKDVELLANVIAVQQETGANLADTLDFLSQSITKRHRMRQTLKGRLAEMQLTKVMVSVAPVIILGICCIAISGVAEFYTSNPIGWVLLGVCALGEMAGFVIIGKLSNLDIK